MSAPLPLRFYNPVKSLCEKVNLDYETVIGTGLSSKMREAYVLADIGKELKDITKKLLKHTRFPMYHMTINIINIWLKVNHILIIINLMYILKNQYYY